jgi:ubiquinone/menaquinone biosynthesis C-methylase UbiE
VHPLEHVRNPWLDIPLSDYEGHMALPEVGQSQMLSDQLAELLAAHRPRSVALIGCAGGNGFERIDPDLTLRVVGVDINADYLAAARHRFDGVFQSLLLLCADAQSDELAFEPVDLVFGGLIFEYADARAVLRNLIARIHGGGVLAAVLQLPAMARTNVTPTTFSSLERLADIMRLLPPEELIGEARDAGLTLSSTLKLELPTGKSFQSLVFLTPGKRV